MRFPFWIVSMTVTAALGAQQNRTALTARIDSVVAAEMERTGTPGISVAFAQRGKLVLAKGYGTANVESDDPATSETVYRIASITKQFTATAIMILVDQGKIALSDELTKFLPDYPTQGHRVTIEHLLTHTSGIRDYTSLGARFWSASARLDLSTEQMVTLFEKEPFDFNPGERYSYDNAGYFLLGAIIEKVSGQSLGRFFDEALFRPLGLRSTRYCDDRAIVPHRAAGYAVAGGKLANALPITVNVLGGAGSICSTVLDLVTWQQAFNEARLITPASRDRIRTPGRLTSGQATSYGFGLGIGALEGRKLLAHGGGVFGFMTWLGYFPDDDLTVTVLTNNGAGPAKQIGRLIARIALGLPVPAVADLPVPADLRRRLVGRYEAGGEKLVIVDSSGGLWIERDDPRARLLYQGDGVFRTREDLETTFRVEAGIAPTTVIVLAGGTTTRAKRVESP